MKTIRTISLQSLAKTAAAGLLAVSLLPTPAALAAGGDTAPLIKPEEGWSFSGFFGRYDQAALQRGFQVYQQLCSACHGMDLLAYRNLGDAGGPEFSEEQVSAIAAQAQVLAGPDDQGNESDEYGQPLRRPGKPTDSFANPYPNKAAARVANGGAYPPDLSVINKARHGGADYLYSLLQGYKDAPEGVEMRPGMYYNIYYPGGQIAMPQILYPDIVAYEDGTEATVPQLAHDVTQFLEWAGEPKMEVRKKMGSMVMLYLALLTVLFYLSYRRVWRNVDH